jgi:glycosyltransferase involved in cell wall biosynthesis
MASLRVLFVYIDVNEGFSGQAQATELIIEGLQAQGQLCRKKLLPYLDRDGRSSKLVSGFLFFWKLLRAYASLVCERVPNGGAVHLSLGLTRFALLRDGLALCLARMGNARRIRSVVALNGSVFTSWAVGSLEARLFRWVIRGCDVVTCVGHSHREALQKLGVPDEKIEIVPNVCEYDGVSEADVIAKQTASGEPSEVLFLSSLTDTKGYPEYLEALEIMARDDGAPIHAVLCGPIMMDAYRKRFNTAVDATKWINVKLAVMNQSGRIQSEWIRGASGAEKQALFEQAQIFVLPTQYPVEAQPLAVIEAMAHGCAIVTTDVGELPSTVDDASAIVLSTPTADTVKRAISRLVADEQLRLRLGRAALNQFKSKFNRERYVQRWADLLKV